MGNSLCGHEPGATADPVTAAAQAAVFASGSVQHSAVAAEIEVTMTKARAEVDKSWQRRFCDEYEAGQVVGHGAFSKVQACTHRQTGAQFAVKVVEKVADSLKQREDIIREVAIMRTLAGHPNVVQLEAVFEDDRCFYLVMELCSGGELFDQIVTRRHFSEQDAAAIMRSLLAFVAFAHSKHVVHRDLKPENLLLSSKDSGAVLKVADFGTSEFCKPGQRLNHKFGTPYYVAPEVLSKEYGPLVDIWSAGVIAYIILSGYPPFAGATDAQVLQRVKAGTYSFAAKEWEAVTEAAKGMITHMLADEAERSSAAELLQHAWFQTDLAAHRSRAQGNALGVHIVRRLRGFAKLSHMKRLALTIMARSLTDNDVSRLRALFMSMDKDDDGAISPKDLHQALQQVGVVVGDDEMSELFHVSSLSSQPGSIDYEEFIAAMLSSKRVAKHLDAVRSSFEKFDKDGDGFISVQDMALVLQEEQPAMKGAAGRRQSLLLAMQLVREVDLDKDGIVSYEEFRNMWATPEPVAA